MVARLVGRVHATTGRCRDAVVRSLITLKALTYEPTGGIVAAATTSLPEALGGVRNWDYRYCWLRDATFTLLALMRRRLPRRGAWPGATGCSAPSPGDPGAAPDHVRPRGRAAADRARARLARRATRARGPVRIGNAASEQLQLDVYGEVIDALYQARARRPRADRRTPGGRSDAARVARDGWREPDEGIWEVRGPRRHFTHSKVMAWVAFDRAVKAVERFGLDGPVDRWRALRDEIHDEVCREGFDAELGAFTQSYGSTRLDASLLMIPLVGFLPADDPRVVGTVAAIERDLMRDGFVERYARRRDATSTASRPARGRSSRARSGSRDDLALRAGRTRRRHCSSGCSALRNDVGLLSEEYDRRDRAPARELPAGLHARRARRRGAHARRRPVQARGAPRSRRDRSRRAMTVVELRDRDAIADFCRRRPAVHAYELGDLDDFFWPHTRWLGWQPGGRLEQLALLYDEPDPPVLLALAEEPEDGMVDLLRSVAADLPGRLYAHLSPVLLDTLAPAMVPSAKPVPHCKLGLVDPSAVERHDTDEAELLGASQLAEIDAFYQRAYPGTWFQARMLETGRYVGIRRDGELACVAGIHVWSPTWGVAALGNVATCPRSGGPVSRPPPAHGCAVCSSATGSTSSR